MFGVIIMTDPSLVFVWLHDHTRFDKDEYPNFSLGVFLALTHSFASGAAYLFMRRMKCDVDPSVSLFYFGAMCLIGSILPMLYFDSDISLVSHSWSTITLIVAIIALGFLSQWGVNMAIALGRAGPLAAINYV